MSSRLLTRLLSFFLSLINKEWLSTHYNSNNNSLIKNKNFENTNYLISCISQIVLKVLAIFWPYCSVRHMFRECLCYQVQCEVLHFSVMESSFNRLKQSICITQGIIHESKLISKDVNRKPLSSRLSQL